jgi:hypothetical protein
MMKMIPITSAIWIREPRLNTKNPSSHKIKRIIPINNKRPMLPPFYLSAAFFRPEHHLVHNSGIGEN